jgi:hypothetical protein
MLPSSLSDKALLFAGIASVGAPGFEPGTSSPPGLFAQMVGVAPAWREMSSEQGNLLAVGQHSPLVAKVGSRSFVPGVCPGGGV